MYSELQPLKLNENYLNDPIVIPLNGNSSSIIRKFFENELNDKSSNKLPNFYGDNKFNFTVGDKPAVLTSKCNKMPQLDKSFVDSFEDTREKLFPLKDALPKNVNEDIQYETIIVFLISFILLYLISPNISFLSYEDKNMNKLRPNLFRIILLSFVIAVFFLMQSNITLLEYL